MTDRFAALDHHNVVMAERVYVMECWLREIGQQTRDSGRFAALCRWLSGPTVLPRVSIVLRAIASHSDLSSATVMDRVARSLSKSEQRTALAFAVSERFRGPPHNRGVTSSEWMQGPSLGISRGWYHTDEERAEIAARTTPTLL